MAKKRVRTDPAGASEGGGFEMTSMIDVTFLLIIFFMCVTELADSSKAKLKLPLAQAAEIDEVVPGRLVINIVKKTEDPNSTYQYKQGDLVIQQEVCNMAQLDSLLKELELKTSAGSEFAKQAILIRADRQVEYYHVNRVLGACIKRKIWRIAFATAHPDHEH